MAADSSAVRAGPEEIIMVGLVVIEEEEVMDFGIEELINMLFFSIRIVDPFF